MGLQISQMMFNNEVRYSTDEIIQYIKRRKYRLDDIAKYTVSNPEDIQLCIEIWQQRDCRSEKKHYLPLSEDEIDFLVQVMINLESNCQHKTNILNRLNKML